MITRPKTRAMPTVPRAPPYSALAMIAPPPAKTNAKAAKPSARERRARSGRGTISGAGHQLPKQDPHSLCDLVSDPPHRLEVLTLGVLELPVLVSLSGIDGAGVAAAHRDHDVGRANRAACERLRKLPREIDVDLRHRLDDDGIEPLRRLAARGADSHPALGQLAENPGGHLAPSGVVHAHEQNFRDITLHTGLHTRKHIPLTYITSIDICE